MGRKGNTTYLKRLNSPGFWRIEKKRRKYAGKPRAGAHPRENCFTLLYVLRDLLELAANGKEAKAILHDGNVLVDGRVRKDPNFPVGLMDVIEIKKIDKTYRIVPDKLYNLKLIEIDKDKEFKLCKIKNKTLLKKGTVQLNLHDGTNIIVPVSDPKAPKEDVYKVHDVVKVNVNTKEIVDHLKFEENMFAFVHAGINNGRSGNIIEIKKVFGPHASTLTLDDKGNHFDTSLDFVMVLGEKKPVIEMEM